MDNRILELLLIIEKQESEIRELRAVLDRITRYIEVYEEIAKGEKK